MNVLNLSCSIWEKILLNNYKIDLLSKMVEKAEDLSFNSIKKTITCGNCIIRLSKLDLNINGLKINDFNYSNETTIKIKYLARCIANLLETKSKKRPGEDFEIVKKKRLIDIESESELNKKLINACLHNHLKDCKQLIATGADINAKNSLGDTPLISAICYENFQICKYLINYPNLDVNLPDNNGDTPLIHAVQCNNLRMCKELIQRGANINAQNNKKITAIWNAALIPTSIEIVNLFIEEASAKKISPLTYISRRNFNIFKLLIDSGANIEVFDREGRTLLDTIKEKRPVNYRDKARYLKNKSLSLNHRHKIFESKLRLAHAWNIGGIATLRNFERNYSFKLEGSYCEFWLHKMSKNLSLFCKKYPQSINKSLFKETFINAATSSLEKIPEKQLERIKQGLPTLVKCNNENHNIIFFFWENQLIIGDCGAASDTPIEAFHYDLETLTKEHFKSINDLENKSEDDYKELIFIHLKKQLNFKKNYLDDYLEKLGSKNLCMQTVDNCTWTSSMAVIFAFFLLSEIKKNKKISFEEVLKMHRLVLKKQVKIYHLWERFQKICSLERFLKFIDIHNNSDLEIIDKIKDLAKNSNDPELIKQTADLLEANDRENEEIDLITSKINSLSLDDEPYKQN
jgi:ankyrin repeat protein